ncbi:Hypothetical predicted protein [Mytilus galloprovincialis]|uniref:Uncharacterized protein n=1 Tax=Mytilus galloprovincialis TaxID=29158 RepID=A0A8B6EBL4_MYTGA|nr:Hypothetical predicted protein [Mytilus galloprovincialis]
MLTLMHTRQDKIETEVVGLANSLKHCKERINSVDTNLSQLNENLPKTVSQQISQLIDDKSEEEKREAPVIIFGIFETEEGGSKMKDTEFIQGLCSDSLGIDNIAIDEITRLGAKPKKGSGKSRLTRQIPHKKEREINNALRIELGQMKKDFPHRSWAIRREKIVELPKSGIPPWAPIHNDNNDYSDTSNVNMLTVSVDNFVPVNSYDTVTVNDNTIELNISQGVSDTQSVKEDKKFTSKDNMKSLRVLFSNVDTLSLWKIYSIHAKSG